MNSTESVEFEKYFCKKAVFEPTTSYVTSQDSTTAPAQHMWGTGTLNWTQFMLQCFIIFPEFSESSAHLGKSLVGQHLLRRKSMIETEFLLHITMPSHLCNEPILCYSSWLHVPYILFRIKYSAAFRTWADVKFRSRTLTGGWHRYREGLG